MFTENTFEVWVTGLLVLCFYLSDTCDELEKEYDEIVSIMETRASKISPDGYSACVIDLKKKTFVIPGSKKYKTKFIYIKYRRNNQKKAEVIYEYESVPDSGIKEDDRENINTNMWKSNACHDKENEYIYYAPRQSTNIVSGNENYYPSQELAFAAKEKAHMQYSETSDGTSICAPEDNTSAFKIDDTHLIGRTIISDLGISEPFPTNNVFDDDYNNNSSDVSDASDDNDTDDNTINLSDLSDNDTDDDMIDLSDNDTDDDKIDLSDQREYPYHREIVPMAMKDENPGICSQNVNEAALDNEIYGSEFHSTRAADLEEWHQGTDVQTQTNIIDNPVCHDAISLADAYEIGVVENYSYMQNFKVTDSREGDGILNRNNSNKHMCDNETNNTSTQTFPNDSVSARNEEEDIVDLEASSETSVAVHHTTENSASLISIPDWISFTSRDNQPFQAPATIGNGSGIGQGASQSGYSIERPAVPTNPGGFSGTATQRPNFGFQSTTAAGTSTPPFSFHPPEPRPDTSGFRFPQTSNQLPAGTSSQVGQSAATVATTRAPGFSFGSALNALAPAGFTFGQSTSQQGGGSDISSRLRALTLQQVSENRILEEI